MMPIGAAADRRLPFPDKHFDVVITVFMIEHLPPDALDRFYSEAHRVLKPNGRLVVGSDNAIYDKVFHPIERLLRQGRLIRNDPTHINLMTPKQCETGIVRHGFQLKDRAIHWIAGRHAMARGIYKMLPASLAEALFSTMFVIVAEKQEKS